MQIFITGTDTDIGKTITCGWICLHTNYSYFKPIQTGSLTGKLDSQIISCLSPITKIYSEIYVYKKPVSPHLAANLENHKINLAKIKLPNTKNLIIEGVGGLLVPLNEKKFLIDLISRLNIPVILVTSCKLGTINHTLLSLQALKRKNIPILGVIMNGKFNKNNFDAIKKYGKIKILAQIPFLKKIDTNNLKKIPLSFNLKCLLKEK